MKEIFGKIADHFQNDPQTGNPYGLTDGEINALRRLQTQDEYQVWMSALDKVIHLHSEALMASDSAYQDSALKNQIKGIRKAGTFVDEVILRIDSKEENERKRTNRAERTDRSQRRRALFGTPFGARRNDLFKSANGG